MSIGLYGDMCPRCWEKDRRQVEMTLLHRTQTHDYTAPKGHNGGTFMAVEWCPACGTIRHTVDYKGGQKEHIKIFVPERDA